MSLSDKSAASCARRDSVLTRNGRSTFRCVWKFSLPSGGVANKSSEVELRSGLSGSACAAVAVVGHTAVGDRLVTVQCYHCHSSVGDRLGTVLFTLWPGVTVIRILQKCHCC